MSRRIWTPPWFPAPYLKALSHAGVHSRCKGRCFAPFGEAAVSKALSVKRTSCMCNFLCKYVFCLQQGRRKAHRETKHEVEKI